MSFIGNMRRSMVQKLRYIFRNETPSVEQPGALTMTAAEVFGARLWMSFDEWLTWLHAELEFMAWQQQTLSDDGCPHHND